MKDKTQCANGHDWTPENTYVWPGNGSKRCKTCRAESQARARIRNILRDNAITKLLKETAVSVR
jgi:hypothetical protein